MSGLIVLPNDFATFDFNKLTLSPPISLMSNNESTFFIKLSNGGDRPLFIQTTRCSTKKGIVKSSKKYYFDLVFDNYSETIITWLETLEEHCKQVIVSNSDKWFAEPLTLDDIEVLYTPIIKVKGKSHFIMTNIKTDDEKELPLVKIYNENHTTMTPAQIDAKTEFNTILEIKGVRFSSKKIFIEIETKHIMVLEEDELLDSYFIPNGVGNTVVVQEAQAQAPHEYEPEHEPEHEPVQSEQQELEMATQQYQEPEPEPAMELDQSLGDVLEYLEDVPIEVVADGEQPLKLKGKEQYYYELYKEAKTKALDAKRSAILAYLEAKKIKNTYMVELQENADDFDDEIDEMTEDALDDL